MKTLVCSMAVYLFGLSGLYAQSHKTEQCTDECVYGFMSKLRVCYISDEAEDDCRPDSGSTVGLLSYGEVVSTDITSGDGGFTLIIPDYQETDGYNIYFFKVYKRYRSCDFFSGERMDTLIWDNNDGSALQEHIQCLKHGKKKTSEFVPPLIPQKISVEAFPVPATDVLTLRFSEAFSGTALFISMTGTPALKIDLDRQKEKVISVENLSGMYVLRLVDRQGRLVETLKVIMAR